MMTSLWQLRWIFPLNLIYWCVCIQREDHLNSALVLFFFFLLMWKVFSSGFHAAFRWSPEPSLSSALFMCSESHTKYTVSEKLGLICVNNTKATCCHEQGYICPTSPTVREACSMYKLISSTLFLWRYQERSLKKIFTLRRRRQKSEDTEADLHVRRYLKEGNGGCELSVSWNLRWEEEELPEQTKHAAYGIRLLRYSSVRV